MSEQPSHKVSGGRDGGARDCNAPGRPDNRDDKMVVDDAQAGADADDRDKQTLTALRPPPRKRRRTVISCTECHRRKQKCNRKLPCANCIERHKQDSCEYESGAPTARDLQKHRIAEGGAYSAGLTAKSGESDNHWQNTSAGGGCGSRASSKPVNFGYSQTGASTLGFLQKLEDAQSPLSHLNPDSIRRDDHFNTRERYKTLIRQLPARMYIDKLVDVYFIEFNWQYQGLDRDVFDKHLQEWYRLPFNVLTTGGPQALSSHLRAFPALLFQVLALALLLLHPKSDQVFESLKYAGNMTFDDLAMDYSESGMAILSLLGKRQMTITTVYTGFLRASFLKYAALVTESWHAIGSAIRDGQEIGLHRDNLDPKPKDNTPEAILENQWEIQRRRKLWITLVWWDLHTAVVLGRPASIDHSQEQQRTLPTDAKMNILATSSSSSSSPLPTPLVPRTESDPPTPLTRLLFAVALGNQLRTIYTLERTLGPNPHSFAMIDNLHQEFLSLEGQIPAWLRLENPDTKYDSLPECYWIPYARAQMPQMLAFNIMALHRPYIFTRQRSRIEALKASLGMLQAQRYHFSTLRPEHYKMFTLFFGTFDAIVIVAAVFILFPKEFGKGEYVDGAVRQFGWAVERFRAMSGQNGLANAALGVLRVLGARFVRALGMKEDVIFGEDDRKDGKDGTTEKVPPPVTNAGLMPLPWADGQRVPSRAESSGLVDSGAEGIQGGGAGAANTPFTYASGPGPLSVSPTARTGAMMADHYPTMTTNLQTHTTTAINRGPSISSSASPFGDASDSNPPGSIGDTQQAGVTAMATARSWTGVDVPGLSSTMGTPSMITENDSSNNHPTLDAGPGGGGAVWDSTWNLNIPSDFDWTILQPLFATSDLLYNDLQLHADGSGSSGGWGAAGGGNVLDAHTTTHPVEHGQSTDLGLPDRGGGTHGPNSGTGGLYPRDNRDRPPNGGEGNNNNMNPWIIDGDFGDHSFWSLLNQFGPPAPPPPGGGH